MLLSQKRVDGIKKCYTIEALKDKVEALPFDTRMALLDNFDFNNITIFNKFVNNPELITYWKRYFNDKILWSAFCSLDETEWLKFIERYGDISDVTLKNLKSLWYKVTVNDKFKRLSLFPDATHDIAYFNKRRAEMLPSKFGDIATKQICRMHEVDSFIEIELQFGGKARASLSNEAGDIIMEGGSLNGKSLDPLGLSLDSINPWIDNFDFNFERFLNSINKHFKKIHTPDPSKPPLDIVVIDFKYMDEVNPTLKQQVLDYIEANHQQYNNSTYLIKLNL